MNLTKENYRLIAAKLYRNPILIDNEFSQDLVLISRIVNRMKKFHDTGELKVKLLFNHYKVACNCFGTEYVHKAIFLLSDSTVEKLLISMVWAFSGIEETLFINEKLIINISKSEFILPVIERITNEIRE